MSDESAGPNRPDEPNWLKRQLTRRQNQSHDTIAAQVGEDAHNVVVGKNIIQNNIQIGSIKLPVYLPVILVIGLVSLLVVTLLAGRRTSKAAKNANKAAKSPPAGATQVFAPTAT